MYDDSLLLFVLMIMAISGFWKVIRGFCPLPCLVPFSFSHTEVKGIQVGANTLIKDLFPLCTVIIFLFQRCSLVFVCPGTFRTLPARDLRGTNHLKVSLSSRRFKMPVCSSPLKSSACSSPRLVQTFAEHKAHVDTCCKHKCYRTLGDVLGTCFIYCY